VSVAELHGTAVALVFAVDTAAEREAVAAAERRMLFALQADFG